MSRQARYFSGFTLIELMMVVAILGVLYAIAIPQYQDYVTRARWSDNVQSVGQLKQAIADCMQSRTQASPAPPCSAIGADAGTSADLIGAGFLPANFVPAAAFGNVGMTVEGAIEIVGAITAGNCTVTLTPQSAANAVFWIFENAAGGCTRARTGLGS